jgi:hypothetical protein
MTKTTSKIFLISVIEPAIAYYRVEAEDARTAARDWEDGEVKDRDDEALESEVPCTVRERQPDGTWRIVPPSDWEDGAPAATAAVPRLLAACRMVVDRWERGDLAEAARACGAAIAEAGNAAPLPPGDPAKKPYSVLLLYPDYANGSGTETYYAFVEAADPIDAVAVAQRQASGEDEHAPDDYAPLLVIEGHHYGQPLFNQ